MSIGHHSGIDNPNLEAGKSYDNTAIGLNGTVGGFTWYVAFENNDDNFNGVAKQDADTVGVFLKYALGDSDNIYVQHVEADVDNVVDDPSATVLGYSHSIGPGVTFIAEYADVDKQADTQTLALVLKVDF